MTAFAFPQPDERQNASAVPVPEPTLAALLALALIGQEHLTTEEETFCIPQCSEAVVAVQRLLDDRFFAAAVYNAWQMKADLEAEYPF